MALTSAYKGGMFPTPRLGALLRRWREAARLTQDEVADHLGVKQQTVSGWERDEGRPRVTRAPALDQIFGLPPGTVGSALQAEAEQVPPSNIPDDPDFTIVSGSWADIAEEDRRMIADLSQRLRRRS